MRHKRRGVALLLVLWMVVLLATVTIAASAAARSSSDLVTARRASATARSMAESGIASAVASINDSLRAMASDTVRRDAYLNALDAGVNNGVSVIGRVQSDTLFDGAFVVAIIDVGARLDINSASEASLQRFLTSFTDAGNAGLLARQIAERVRGDGITVDSARLAQLAQDSLIRSLLGQSPESRSARQPFETLDDLAELGVDEQLLGRIAPYLTVDGEAVINRTTAPPEVLAAATGSLSDAPTRLLIVTRGWQLSHPLTQEIQAVYDVSPTGLVLVRWRERVL